MSNRRQPKARIASDNYFRLNPLAAGVRVVMAGGLLVGSVAPGHAGSLPVPVPGQGWVSAGAASKQIIGNTLRIDQKTDRAILNWQKFNVGRENTVQFVQPGSSSIALNRIYDANPSRILGRIIANGQVYLYNKNGFVFGKDSVVNANSFMASTLEITDEAFSRGITRVFDENGSAALGIEGTTLDPKTVKILIEAGAKIHTDKAGRIIIAAPTIENKGSLSTEEQGQIILAASQDKVYLQAADKESPFAGLVVEVETGGKVSNLGDIFARQGNVTLAGFAVNQQGRISATSSVNVNGSIRLLAQETHGKEGSKLIATKTNRDKDLNDGLGTEAKTTFAAGSVTQIFADAGGGSAIDEQTQPNAYLEVTGNTVHMQSGSTINAPAGKVKITATDNLHDPTQGSKGRIKLDRGAVIDVSGTKGVKADMERNVGEISVQSFELRDAPRQRTGVLKGETVRVDLRKHTRIVDTSGAKARISRSIDERLGKGGEITLTSSGDVIVDGGAKIDISGGSVRYKDGYIKTTKLLTEYGSIVDISDADPNEHYIGIFGTVTKKHEKWNVLEIWDLLGQIGLGQFERGYVEGKAAGQFNIQAPRVAWKGDLVAGSSAGQYQRAPGDRPDGGSVVFDSVAFATAFQDVNFQTKNTSPAIGLKDEFPKTATNQVQPLVLSTDLTNRSGVQHVIVKTKGQAEVLPGTDVRMVPGGEFSVQAGGIDVQGKIHAPGGSINLNVVEKSAGEVNLGAASVLDVSGRWVNELQQDLASMPVDPLYLHGGTITVRSEADLFLRAGAKINADGGAWLAQNGKLTAGNGGKIELAAVGNGVASAVHLDGEVSAASLTQGGSLTVSSGKVDVVDAKRVQIKSLLTDANIALLKQNGLIDRNVSKQELLDTLDAVSGDGQYDHYIQRIVNVIADPLTLAVVNGHFAFDPKSGFGAINLIGNFEGVTVGSGTSLDLKTKNLVLDDNFSQNATDSSIRKFTHVELLPEHLRQPFQLSLTGNTDVTLATGSAIVTDKQSTVSLASWVGGINVDGTIQAPAGKINLSINPIANSEYDPAQSIRLGAHARLLAQGTARLNPTDVLGHRTGDVLDGGQVVFDLKRGYLIAEQGSLIDVSGTRSTLDIAKGDGKGEIPTFIPTDVASNAGSITITAAEGVVLDGRLRGKAGSGTTRAGRFSLTLDNTSRQPPEIPTVAFPNNPLLIQIRENQQRQFSDDLQFGVVIPDEFNGKAIVAANMLEAGGFGDVRLSTPDQIRFQGNVGLTTTARLDLDASSIAWEGLNGVVTGAVTLNTALLRMGSSQRREVSGLPVTGGGHFNANAQWIELFGATRWDDFEQINLNSAHDMRTVGLRPVGQGQREFLGAMVTAANLKLHASQIYPTTLSKFTFAVKNNPNGQIKITGANTDKSPLSAGGELSFEAPIINQSGVIKAPLGTIKLKAGSTLTLGENSLTSVSAVGQVIPFGVTQGGIDWLYPLDFPYNLVFNAPPEKKLVLQSPEVKLAKGSVVDLSGGGDLFGYEFQPGAGGSYDYLKPGSESYEGGFAVVPNLGSELAPYDHFETAGAGIELGSKVYLSGAPDLPAGEYTILPARYALLPGAFLVTPQAKTQDQTFTTFTKDGLPIVAGYQTMAGSGTKESRWSGFRIENGADVRKRSQYEEHLANEFYAAKALKNETTVPVLPKDSGQISIIAQNKLILDGQFLVDAMSGGRGAKMDIAANNIRVVNQLSATPTAGMLEILADDLSALKIDSLMLGGARNRNANTGETDVDVTAQQVIFSANSKVHVSDMIAAATDRVEVGSGAELTASGHVNSGDSVLNVTGDGALLRVSGDKQVTLNRTYAPGAPRGTKGELIVASGSKLNASESMLLDASKSTQLLGDIEMQGGSLNLGANTINLGEVDSLGGDALNLSNRKLLNLAVDELVMTARDSIGIYGNLGLVDGNGHPVIGDDGLQKAVEFDRLVINAAGFTGHGAAGDKARIKAGSLLLQNTGAAGNSQVVDGRGQLDLLTESVEIGDGNFSIQGFNAVNVKAGREFRAVGEGKLYVAADLNVTTPALTAAGGADLKVDASGHSARFNASAASAAVSSGFGAAINVIADTIDFNTTALLPTGSLSLKALTGDVSLASDATIDLAGRWVNFADAAAVISGGHFTAIAKHGSVAIKKGARVDISGYVPGGSLTLIAPEQTLALDGELKSFGGSAVVDVGSANFDALMTDLKAADITNSIYFRMRNADIIQNAGSTINAHKVTLVADSGAMSLAGAIHADAAKEGGSIQLYAGDSITLQSGSELTAKGAKGGKVLLSSVDSDGDNVSGIELKAGSLIDVSGAAAETGGEVTLRALRNGSGINIQPIAGTVKGFAHKSPVYDANGVLTAYGYRKFYAEGVQKYTIVDINGIKADTDAYMTAANMQGVTDSLGGGIRLKAGVELDYNGNLVLADKWDLADWRYNEGTGLSDMPGNLVIRATGGISLNASISDGFKNGLIYYDSLGVNDLLMAGDSWSYQIAAGSDLPSADTLAMNTENNLTIGSNVSVRTGSGDMNLAAGGNIVFTDETSTVYSAGKPAETDRYGSLYNDIVGFIFYSEYPVQGGDITLTAGKDIYGAVSSQFINPWLLRQGNWTDGLDHAGETPTAWGVALGYTTDGYGNAADSASTLFKQNIGSFGGGKVEVEASGNIRDLSVMMPTTGKQIGQTVFDPMTPGPESYDYKTNEVQVLGGGEMRVSAGKDIMGGAYFLGQGDGSLVAEGSIMGGSQFTSGPQLVMGDTHMKLTAKRDVSITGVSDPMMLHSGDTNFFSYGDASTLLVGSLSGDVHLGADASKIGEIIDLGSSQKTLAQIYPGSLLAVAVGGSVILDNEITLFPSAKGRLDLVAEQDITSKGDATRLGMSDADRSLLPTALRPMARNNMSDSAARLNPFGLASMVHATKPVHTGDHDSARLVTRQGDIKNIQFNLAKKAMIQTGRDFTNVLLNVQHANLGDVSMLDIGRDLRYTSDRDADGALKNNPGEIKVSGAGEVLIRTGRHVDLGASGGVSTVGNVVNNGLPDEGANLTMLVGANGELDYAGFIGAYLQDNQLYGQAYYYAKNLIVAFMRQRLNDGTLSESAAMQAFAKLKNDDFVAIQPYLNAVILPVFFNEIKESGKASAGTKALGNERGFAAIETLFPGSSWDGDLSMPFSKIQTIDNGNINLMVPGGGVNAGLAVSFTGAKPASELGIVVQRQGDINVMVRDDFEVNTSRVFALDGGDIMVWSSEGDIDAGRGAKSAIAVPPPVISFDENGNLKIEFPPTVTGSGIRTAASSAGVEPGDVYLFAPKGVIDAGEAGIAGNNVFFAAPQVLNGQNVQVGGVGTGVPTAPVGSVAAGLTGTSNMTAGVSQVAESSVSANTDKDKIAKMQHAALGMLTVEVLGFGEGTGDAVRNPGQQDKDKDKDKDKEKSKEDS